MRPDRLPLLHEVADAVAAVLSSASDFGPSGVREGQYALDLSANEAALGILRRAGVGVLSEESDFEAGTTGEVVVLDPVDGSTNASRGLPWYATAVCVVDDHGPVTALVVNQASGERFWAGRGTGAFCNGRPLRASGRNDLGGSLIGFNGRPRRSLGEGQSRSYGAAALDLCMVASGSLDGYVDCAADAHGVWDYLASTLICREAGATVVDAYGRDLVVLDHSARRTPVAGATPSLCAQLQAALLADEAR